MKSFKDSKGREWKIEINVPQADLVLDRLKIDLLDVASEKSNVIARLIGDPRVLVNALFVLCEEQCKAANVSDVDFGRALAGDVIDAATDALMMEITSFFRSSQRQILTKIWEKTAEVEKKSVDLALAKLSSLNLDHLTEQALDDSVSNSQASSASSSGA